MKDQLISFETAKLAKEKGFDWVTYKYFELALNTQEDPEFGTSGPFGWKEGELNLQSSYFINNHKNIDSSNISWYLCSTPTQSLLQRWLREVHNIEIVVHPKLHSVLEKMYVIDIFYSDQVGDISYNGVYNLYKTYEDALEQALFGALKLIEL